MNRTIIGDCRDSMRDLIVDGVRVQMCVTSPPYWGLRDYGVAGQIGLEPTIHQYVETMVEVFGLVRALLADDGTAWLNIGDCYAGGGRGGNFKGESGLEGSTDSQMKSRHALIASHRRDDAPVPRSSPRVDGLKPKDLIMMPARVAIALQADGWWVRQDIIWHKPNPMPESVVDRCTKAHEYLFLLSKSERYYFDAGAISEAASEATHERYARANGQPYGMSNWARGGEPHTSVELSAARKTRKDRTAHADMPIQAGDRRNKRSVWTVGSEPYPEAHFATFPPTLIEPCILAGSRPGDIVFDPFMGSGTTGQVAQALGRRWLGCELNPEYVTLERKRTAQQGMPLE